MPAEQKPRKPSVTIFKLTANTTCGSCGAVNTGPVPVDWDMIDASGDVEVYAKMDAHEPCVACGADLDLAEWYDVEDARWTEEAAGAPEPESFPSRPVPPRPSVDNRNIVAVYGTLRSGCGNHWMWMRGGAESMGHDVMPEFRLVGGKRSFPYAVPARGAASVVELIHCDDDTLAMMDALEGVPHHYVRDEYVTEGGITAWMYTPAHESTYRDLDPVTLNDRGEYDWCADVAQREELDTPTSIG